MKINKEEVAGSATNHNTFCLQFSDRSQLTGFRLPGDHEKPDF